MIDPTVEAAQRGDDAAFEVLYDIHAPQVYGTCLRLAGDAGAAADLVQDVFVEVWERIASYRGESSFSTWLHRVAINTALDASRRNHRRNLRVAVDADLRGTGIDGPLAGAARSTDVGLSIDLDDAIRRLPPGARAVFVLHDVEGYRHAEIANLLGIAEGTSKAHLFRARRLLREALNR
ncbi:MAG: RNA polymerase sigma factor [Gemmatimonadales bacterium]